MSGCFWQTRDWLESLQNSVGDEIILIISIFPETTWRTTQLSSWLSATSAWQKDHHTVCGIEHAVHEKDPWFNLWYHQLEGSEIVELEKFSDLNLVERLPVSSELDAELERIAWQNMRQLHVFSFRAGSKLPGTWSGILNDARAIPPPPLPDDVLTSAFPTVWIGKRRGEQSRRGNVEEGSILARVDQSSPLLSSLPHFLFLSATLFCSRNYSRTMGVSGKMEVGIPTNLLLG